MKSEILIILIHLSVVFVDSGRGVVYHTNNELKCSGYCTNDLEKCKSRGGRVTGYCTDSLVCCNPLISPSANCGDERDGQIVDFKSPNYPSPQGGELLCSMKVKLLKDVVGLRIDFVHAEMDGQSFTDSSSTMGSCESDMVLLRGFGSWAPQARCGNLSGYSFLIDRDTPQSEGMKDVIHLVALMASPTWRWHIRVIQLTDGNHKWKQMQPHKNINSLTTIRHHHHRNNYQPSNNDDIPIFNKGRKKRSLLTPLDKDESDSTRRFTKTSSSMTTTTTTTSSYDEDDDYGPKGVLNGEDTVISTIPWQVSLRMKEESLTEEEKEERVKVNNCSLSEGLHFCGGVIIGERHVITAAHCFYGISKTIGMVHLPHVKAVVGDTNICQEEKKDSSDELPVYHLDVEKVIIHYAFDSEQILNDVAVVKLKSRIKFQQHIKPILMAEEGEDFTGKEALLSGWGEYLKPTSSSSSSRRKRQISESTTETPLEENLISTTSRPPENEDAQTLPLPITTTTSSPLEHTEGFVATTVETPDTRTTTTTTTPEPITVTTAQPEPPTINVTTSTTSPPIIAIPTTRPPPPTTITTPPTDEYDLATPDILQSSNRLVIQNQTVCKTRDITEYSATEETIMKHMKYRFVFNSTICAEGTNHSDPVSAGRGDSGGPLVVVGKDKVPILVGIVSYGLPENTNGTENSESCNNSTTEYNSMMDYFTSVTFFRKWIDLAVMSEMMEVGSFLQETDHVKRYS